MFLLKIIYIFDSFFSYQIPLRRFSKLINIIVSKRVETIFYKSLFPFVRKYFEISIDQKFANLGTRRE